MKPSTMWKSHRKTITKKNANEKMHSGSQQSVLTVRWHFKWILPLVIPFAYPFHLLFTTCSSLQGHSVLAGRVIGHPWAASARTLGRTWNFVAFVKMLCGHRLKRKWNYLFKKGHWNILAKRSTAGHRAEGGERGQSCGMLSRGMSKDKETTLTAEGKEGNRCLNGRTISL